MGYSIRKIRFIYGLLPLETVSTCLLSFSSSLPQPTVSAPHRQVALLLSFWTASLTFSFWQASLSYIRLEEPRQSILLSAGKLSHKDKGRLFLKRKLTLSLLVTTFVIS